MNREPPNSECNALTHYTTLPNCELKVKLHSNFELKVKLWRACKRRRVLFYNLLFTRRKFLKHLCFISMYHEECFKRDKIIILLIIQHSKNKKHLTKKCQKLTYYLSQKIFYHLSILQIKSTSCGFTLKITHA